MKLYRQTAFESFDCIKSYQEHTCIHHFCEISVRGLPDIILVACFGLQILQRTKTTEDLEGK